MTEAETLALECLAEMLQLRKLEVQAAELWHPGVDREVAAINEHLALIDARLARAKQEAICSSL